jgi:predicted MFS family arabinose efflux permease
MRPLWVIIVCGGAIAGLSVGIRQSFGLFLPPISVDLGIGREAVGFSFGLVTLLWGVLAPFTGAIADRFGTGRVVLVGALSYCLGLYTISTATGESDLVTAGILVGLGLSGLGFTVVLGAVGRAAAPERRSTALGLVSMGGSIGQFVALPYAHLLISNLGWASSMFVLLVTASLMAPLAWGLASKPHTHIYAHDQTLREALREAIHHRGFLLLTAGFFVCGFHVMFIATHLPAYLADAGFAPWVGAAALTLVGLANIFGTLGAARLGDFIEKRLALSIYYTLRSLVFLVFIMVPLTEVSVLIFAFTLGLLWLGTVPLTSGLVATLFGPRYMSMLFGIVFMSHNVGSFTGAWLGGFVYDSFGSYAAMWWLSIALGLVSAMFHYPIKERPVARLAAQPAE